MSRIIKHQVGDIEVIALTDGTGEFSNEQFPETKPDEIATLIAAAGHDTIKTNFNAFLIRTKDHLTLVDAGLRDLAGPSAGFLPDALAEAGVDNDDITRLFVTHMHPDHIAGAITPDGKAVFANAQLQLNEDERALWSDPSNFSGASEEAQNYQQLAQTVLDAFADRIAPFTGAADLGQGINVLPLPGHTVGHSGLRVSSGADQFIMAGDIVHAQTLQLANPNIGVVFDMDGGQAAEARKNMLDMLATDNIPFSGGHIQQPAIGRVAKSGDGYVYSSLTD